MSILVIVPFERGDAQYIIWRIRLMYVYEKKIPVKNTVRKNIRRNDGQVKENRGSRYYLDDTRRDVKLPSTNVVQNV